MTHFLLLLACLLTLCEASAQQRDSSLRRLELPGLYDGSRPEQTFDKGLNLIEPIHWSPRPAIESPTPVVTMSSLVVIPRRSLPKRVNVLPDNVLRIGNRVTLSVGSAYEWSPWPWAPYPAPGAYLDARTLSMPMPR